MFQTRFLTGAVGAGLLLSACGARQAGQTQTETRLPAKPNIIFILADDLGYGDLSFQGQKRFQTPHIDRMAAEGLVFSNHYSGSTVCAPSRSALMTGQHTGHTPIRGNREHKPEGQEPLPAQAITVAELLKSAGYVTGAFGKWGLGYPASEGDPNNQGFDRFFGYNCQRLAHNYYPAHLWNNQEKVFLHENDNRGTGAYAHDLYHREALNFIRENKDKPFFLYLPYVIPHAELLVPEDEIFEKFKGELEETQPFKGVDDGPNYRLGPYGSQPYPHAAFAAMVTRLDRSVGEILAALQEYGIDKNTLVVFTSDNGPHQEGGADPEFFDSNGPFRGVKRDLYEGGIHVPFVAWWPGVVTPGKTPQVAAFWDFLPTCAEIAGVETPAGLDGNSYLPTLLGKNDEQQQHEYLYWEFHERGTQQAVRMGNWKGIRLKQGSPLELYDLAADPGEQENVASRHPDVVKQLEEILAKARTDSEIWPMK